MEDAGDRLFQFGVIVGTHGLRGDLKVRPLTADSRSLFFARQVLIRDKSGRVQVHEPARVAQHKNNLLLRLRDLNDVDSVQPLVGRELLMRYQDLPALDDDEFYWYQLQGLRVIDRSRGELGLLDDLMETGAHDIYVVHGRFGEVMIPAVSQFVLEINPAAGEMIVDLPEGLVPDNHDL